MTKGELLAAVKEIANERDVKISKKDLSVVADAFYEAIVDDVKKGGRTKFNEITYYKKHVDERKGTTVLGGGKDWVVPEHDEIGIKVSKAFKTALAE